MVRELGYELLNGNLTREEFVAGVLAQGKLSHDAANRLAVKFVLDYRAIEAYGMDHADPLYSEFDRGATYGRAVGTLEDLDLIDRETVGDFDTEFWKIVEDLAVRQFREALNGGRDAITYSAAANGKRWRRITTANPCAFCAMLATRSDYRTRESALYVVGRGRGYGTANYRATGGISYGGTISRGKRKGQDTRRGTRPLGERYHNNCGCSVAEVLGGWEMSPDEEAQYELYHEAAKAVAAEGLPRTAENVMAKMREMGDGIIHDAHKPETQTGDAGGGSRPPGRGAGPFKEMPDPPDPADRGAWRQYWQERQDAIPLDFHGEHLTAHEVELAERMLRAGQDIRWIQKKGASPSHDFFWVQQDRAFEAKSTKARYATIRGRILDATSRASRHGVDKTNFIIDLGGSNLEPGLRSELETYNIGREKHRIQALWVMHSDGTLEQIALK